MTLDSSRLISDPTISTHKGSHLLTCLLVCLLPQAPQRYLVGVRLGTRLLSSCRAKNQKLASTAAAQQALGVLESQESQE